jgi:hypothetical protein
MMSNWSDKIVVIGVGISKDETDKINGIYEIYYGTKATGVHVDNISDKENFEWAVGELKYQVQKAVREEFGIGVSN